MKVNAACETSIPEKGRSERKVSASSANLLYGLLTGHERVLCFGLCKSVSAEVSQDFEVVVGCCGIWLTVVELITSQ